MSNTLKDLEQLVLEGFVSRMVVSNGFWCLEIEVPLRSFGKFKVWANKNLPVAVAFKVKPLCRPCKKGFFINNNLG